MAPSPDRRPLPQLLRVLVLVSVVAAAPLALGPADAAAADRFRSADEIGDDLAEVKAAQSELSNRVATQQREVTELTELQEELTGEISRTATALEAINADLVAVRQEVDLLVVRIEGVKERYTELVSELQVLDAQLADLVAREAAKRIELTEREALLADRLRRANDVDGTSMLEVFLSARSFSDVLTEVSYHLDAGAQDRTLAERIEQDRLTLATLRETIRATRASTNVVRQETAVQRKKLETELARLEATKERLARLEAETARELAAEKAAYEELARTRSDLEATIERGRAEQAALSRQISALVQEEARRAAEQARREAEEAKRAQAARRLEEERRQEATRLSGIPSAFNGTLRWPLIGRITGEWGCSDYPGYGPGGPGCDHYHNGIDIARSCGSRIVAAGSGVVAYVGWNWADGPDPAWMVVIAHSSELISWYAHMRPSAPSGIRVGARVTAGQLIGWEGSTGRSTGCHLHWMVELDGRFVNGRLFL